MSVSSVRDRRRAETVAEIKEAALQQLVDAGPGGFSLRGVARAVGMTVQSLYHYFANRDALLTALIIGFAISLFQSVTQIQEATLSFVPKAIGIGVALLLSGNWMLHELMSFTTTLYGQIPELISGVS